VACPEGQTLQLGSCVDSPSNNSLENGQIDEGDTSIGSFDANIEEANAALDTAKESLKSKINEVKDSANSLFQPISVSGGALPVIDMGSYKGVVMRVDLNNYASSFSVLSTLILALAYLYAASIVLTK